MDHRRIEEIARRWCPDRHAHLVGMTGEVTPRVTPPTSLGVMALAGGMSVLAVVLITLVAVTFRSP